MGEKQLQERNAPMAHVDESKDQILGQQSRIEQLEKQLRDQMELYRREKDLADQDENLLSHVRVGFVILLVVNSLGWMLCLLSRRSGGNTIAASKGRPGRSKRTTPSRSK